MDRGRGVYWKLLAPSGYTPPPPLHSPRPHSGPTHGSHPFPSIRPSLLPPSRPHMELSGGEKFSVRLAFPVLRLGSRNYQSSFTGEWRGLSDDHTHTHDKTITTNWVSPTTCCILSPSARIQRLTSATKHWCGQSVKARVTRAAVELVGGRRWFAFSFFFSPSLAITKRVLEEDKRTKRKTPEVAGDVADDDKEDCPTARDKRARLTMNKIEKESEPGEFTNHEEEVCLCVGVGPHLGALSPATVSEPPRHPRSSRPNSFSG